MTTPVISVQDLTVQTVAGGDHVVDRVGLELAPGEVLGIVGESGSGKSVTCKAILGILPQQLQVAGGSVRIGGTEVLDFGYDQWRALRGGTIAAVFQDPGSYLNPTIPVGRQLQEKLRVSFGLRRREAARRADELFVELGLDPATGVGAKLPSELSGGMLQRTVLAIALAGEPSVLVADEVTTALDVSVAAQVLRVLAARREQTGLSILFVSHDLAVVGSICDRIVVMRSGEIVESGAAHDVLTAPQHPYTQLLISEHRKYGIERILHEGRDRDGVGLDKTVA